MGKQQIALLVTFQASYVGDDAEMPEETTVDETVSLIIPQMDEKFVVLPKVLEGVTLRVIEEHRSKVSAYRAEKERQERERQERAKMFAFSHNGHEE